MSDKQSISDIRKYLTEGLRDGEILSSVVLVRTLTCFVCNKKMTFGQCFIFPSLG